MAYSADSFTAGEQPTTAKWNKLWSNDASFNDGTGIAAGAITPEKLAAGAGTSWAWQTWTPTFTGFSANPTNVVARYLVIGKLCFINFTCTAGTSNATGFTVSLPLTAATITNQVWKARAYTIDNGAAGTGADFAQVVSAGTTITMQHNDNNAGWTASGSKGATFQMAYELP